MKSPIRAFILAAIGLFAVGLLCPSAAIAQQSAYTTDLVPDLTNVHAYYIGDPGERLPKYDIHFWEARTSERMGDADSALFWSAFEDLHWGHRVAALREFNELRGRHEWTAVADFWIASIRGNR